MANSNSSTVKWIIALSISIVMGFAGWTFAGVNGAKTRQMEEYSVKVERNTEEISLLKTQNGIVITKLEYIEREIKEVKELLKDD